VAEFGVSEAVMLRPPLLPTFDPRSTALLATNDVVCSTHRPPWTRIKEQCGRCDTHSGKVCVAEEKRLDRHKKEPWALHGPRASTGCCLSLWVLVIRAAGSGMGAARIGPLVSF
jgi:hypothetical protein